MCKSSAATGRARAGEFGHGARSARRLHLEGRGRFVGDGAEFGDVDSILSYVPVDFFVLPLFQSFNEPSDLRDNLSNVWP